MPTILEEIVIADAAKAAEFEENFLRVLPKPADFTGSNKAWLRRVIVQRLRAIDAAGARAATADPTTVIE